MEPNNPIQGQQPPAPPARAGTGAPPQPPPPPPTGTQPPTGNVSQPPPPTGPTTPPPPPPPPPPVQRSNGLAIAGMIIGIISIPFGFTVFIGIIMAILAIILSIMGKKKAAEDPAVGGRGMAIAGLVCGIIGLAIAVLMITVFAALISTPFWLLSSY